MYELESNGKRLITEGDMAVAAGIVAGAVLVGATINKAADRLSAPKPLARLLGVGASVGSVYLANQFGDALQISANSIEDYRSDNIL